MSTDARDALVKALKAQGGFETRDGLLYFGSTGTINPDALVAALATDGYAVTKLPEPLKFCDDCPFQKAGAGDCPGRWCEKKRAER